MDNFLSVAMLDGKPLQFTLVQNYDNFDITVTIVSNIPNVVFNA